MTSFKGNVLLVFLGLVLIHTATCQTATATDSTVVWAAPTETVESVTAAEVPAEPPTTTTASVMDTTTISATTTVAAEAAPSETPAGPTTAQAPQAPVTIAPTTAPTNQNQPIDQGAPNQMTSQQYAQTGTAPTGTSPPADAAIQADVAMTVIALLNETGYSGSVNDANVQEIVKMLMNGTVPTDADLMRLGIIPTHAPVTTPPTYTIPVPNPLDPVISPLQPVTPAPAPTPTLDLTGPAQPSAGTNNLPTIPNGFTFPSNLFSGLLPPTTPKPFDPFGQPNPANPLPPNSIAPKPVQPVDLLSSFNFPSAGTPGGIAPPSSGILDTQYQQQQQQQQQRNQGMNPMMMMMMMAPEMMETMMSGENPMLTMLFMQSMQQGQRPHPPATPPMGSALSPGSGFPSGGAGGAGGLMMDPGFGGMSAPGAGANFMDLSSLTGANTATNPMGGSSPSANLMPLLNMINQPSGSPSLPGMPLPGAAPTMDMASLLSQFGTLPTGGATPTGVASPTGATGPTDMNLANLISPGTQPTGVSPTLDPFAAMG